AQVGDVARHHANGGNRTARVEYRELGHQAHALALGERRALLVLQRLAARQHFRVVRRRGERLAAREQLGVGAAEHLLGPQAVALEKAVVGETVAPVAVLHAHQRRAVRGERAHALLALAQTLLHRAPLADVACDLGEADDLARVVAHGVDHHHRPETAAVLAQAPALALEAPFAPRPRQGLVGHAVGAVLRGIELRERAADDLFG